MTARRIAFVWDNFGPLHVDRCNAVARHFAGDAEVIGIEIFAQSDLYAWEQSEVSEFNKQTLFRDRSWSNTSSLRIAAAIVSAVLNHECRSVFLAHYDQLAIFLTATQLRMLGVDLFTMGCSKYDDAPRYWWRETVKKQFYKPYMGGVGSGVRSRDYMWYLGLRDDRVVGGYNTVDHDRIRQLARLGNGADPRFEERPFLIVARLIWEKNFPTLFAAYAAYCAAVPHPRPLQIAGSGPLDSELKELAERLGIADQIEWLGFVQTERVATLMHGALCLILPSVSETFGNVVCEALALDLPVLASTQCGASDELVRDNLSGFTFHARDTERLSSLLQQIGSDCDLWQQLRRDMREIAPLADTQKFAQSVEKLLSVKD